MKSTGIPANPLVILIVLALIGWSIYRRTRSQPVRLVPTILITAAVVLLSLVGLRSDSQLLVDPLFIEIAPIALLAGLVLGSLMMRTIKFWRDRSTGQVWMSGGVAYILIWLLTVAFRLGIEYVATNGFSNMKAINGNQAPTTLSTIASDLLFLSVGLWLARGYALLRRYREFSRPDNGIS